MIDVAICCRNEISEKVIWCAASDVRFTAARCRIKDKEIVIHLLVNLHYTGFVAAPVAVVRSGENCHNLLLVAPIVALHINRVDKVVIVYIENSIVDFVTQI